MEEQYGISDLRQYISDKPFFPAISQPPDLLSCHRGLASPHPYDMLIFRSDSNIITPTPTIASGLAGLEMEAGGGLIGGGGSGGDGGATARWPRQETLTLLEIRSRLDPKFKEANQKGPLWDEVSRIMCEEYGYQRSGKKCREKFENLYKYYKKTKEGKAGRQDGKHYRFFRQLEALYGEPTHSSSASETHFNGATFPYSFPINNHSFPGGNQEPYPKLADTSPISSSDYDTTSSDSNDVVRNKKRRGKRGLKARIRESIDAQMKKLMDKQEAWMEKMMSIIDLKERERLMREEQWRKQDAARVDREHKMWANERAWIEARDIALMDAFHKLTGKELRVSPPVDRRDDIWPESEITRLIQLRNGLDLKFQENGISMESLWDEIATKMGCYGHERTGLMCKQKWDSVNNYLLKCNKKRRENSRFEPINSDEGVAGTDHGDSINDSCFRYFIGDSYGRL